MVLCLFLLWMAESNCTYSFLEILSVTAMSETVALRLNFLHWASRRSQCVHCEVAHGRSKESQLFNCILVHPALMSPPPLSAHLSVPSRISQQPWAPVLLSRRVCVSPVKVLVTALCLKGRHDVIATVFVGVWITEEFHFLSLFTFDYSNAFRTLPPLAPQPPQSDMDWVIYPTHPRPTADDPSLWYSLISLGWSGLVNPANQNENEHKKSPRIYCTGPHFKGTVWVCVFVCMHVFVHVCVCERDMEHRSALVLHVSSHFQLHCQLKDAAERFPNKKHTAGSHCVSDSHTPPPDVRRTLTGASHSVPRSYLL